MKIAFLLLVLCSFTLFGLAQRRYYFDDKNSCVISLPPNWNEKSSDNPLVKLQVQAPQTEEINFPPTLLLLTEDVKQSNNKSLEQIRNTEIDSIKQQLGNKLTIYKNEYWVSNNEYWWLFSMSVKMSKKNTYRYFILKTTHRNVIYSIAYRADADYFDKYFPAAYEAMKSLMFLTSDNSDVKNIPNYNPKKNQVTDWLKTSEGKYSFKWSGDNSSGEQSIIVGPASDSGYNIQEIREISQNGKKAYFIADLLPKSVMGPNLTLYTDAVKRYDTVQAFDWRKATYTLHKTDSGFEAYFYSTDSSFEPYSITLTKQQPVADTAEIVAESSSKDDNINNGKLWLQTNIENLYNNSFSIEKMKKVCTSRYVNFRTDGWNIDEGDEKAANAFSTKWGKIYNLKYCCADCGFLIYGQDHGKISVAANFKNKTANGYWFNVTITDKEFNVSYKSDVRIIKNGTSYLIDEALEYWQAEGSGASEDETKNQSSSEKNTQAAELPEGQNELNVPAEKKVFSGCKTVDELGRKLILALKTNNSTLWYNCILTQPRQTTDKYFKQVRECLMENGVSDWGNLTFSRVVYEKRKKDFYRGEYLIFRIEFTYGKDFFGAIGGSNSGIDYKGQLMFYDSFYECEIKRRM